MAAAVSEQQYPRLTVDVGFLDDDHAAAVKKQFPEIADRIGTSAQIEVDVLDLIAFALLRRQRNADGFRTFEELRRHAETEFRHVLLDWNFDGGSIRARFPMDNLTDSTSEMGVGVSLAVLTELLGLPEPDWERIPDPPRGRKDFDFRYPRRDSAAAEGADLVATDGRSFIEVESKGALGSMEPGDPAERKRVDAHRRDVAKKKAFLTSSARRAGVRRMGAITVFPTDAERNARMSIVDPPEDHADADPRRHRLLSRLVFYQRTFRVLTSAEVVAALPERITALRFVDRLDALDGVPLSSSRLAVVRDPLGRGWWRGKTRLWDRIAARAIDLGDGQFLLVGADFEILRVLRNQVHEEILAYKRNARSTWWRGVILVPSEPQESGERRRPQPQRIQVEGIVRVAPSGAVTGLVASGKDPEPRLRALLEAGPGRRDHDELLVHERLAHVVDQGAGALARVPRGRGT